MVTRILKIFFITLGVIFFIMILTGIYLYIADPFGLKPFLFGSPAKYGMPAAESGGPSFLSDEQKNALRTIGINPASIPSQFTPEQEACFVKVLGQTRVDQIKAGSAPTVIEYFQAKVCL